MSGRFDELLPRFVERAGWRYLKQRLASWLADIRSNRLERHSSHGRRQGYLAKATPSHLRRQTFQSLSVALSMALAALCSQRPLRAARSRLTAGMAFGEPRWMLAVSQPMQYRSFSSSRSAGRVLISM